MKPEDIQVSKRQLIRFKNFKSLKHSSSVTVSNFFSQNGIWRNLYNQSARSFVPIFEWHYHY